MYLSCVSMVRLYVRWWGDGVGISAKKKDDTNHSHRPLKE